MRTRIFAASLILLVLAVPTTPAHAGGVVSVCDQAHLVAALAGGGTVSFACSGTILLTSEIVISANTHLNGTGRTVTISGNYVTRVFRVTAGVSFTLAHVTVTRGYALMGGGDGGGIYNDGGTLTVTACTFSDNDAYFYGGGIYNSDGTVTVADSTFLSNGAHYAGGAIYQHGGTLGVSNSTLADNGTGYAGGAIYNDHGTVAVHASTLSGNISDAGGAISSGGDLAVSNSSFFGNSAGGLDGGGGILTYGTATVTNCTLAGNSAGGSNGAGIQNTGALTIQNTIVANSQSGANCYGDMTDGGGNLSYPDTTCPGINLDPLLGTLANNGGPTKTMSLRPGSAALDAAIDAICAALPVNNLDQRGITRRQGLHCDIGAFEARDPTTRRAFLPSIIK